MPFDLNKLLRRPKVTIVKKVEQPQKVKVIEEEEPFQVYIPTFEPESEDESAPIAKKKTSKIERKVPLNPLSDE